MISNQDGTCRGMPRIFPVAGFLLPPLVRNLPSQPSMVYDGWKLDIKCLYWTCAENYAKMCQKLTKFDRSCKLVNVLHCNIFVTYWLDINHIDTIFINHKITLKAAFNSAGKCKMLLLNLVEIIQLLHGEFVPRLLPRLRSSSNPIVNPLPQRE